MSADIDKTTEARRKAARNGEEDPFIVAQRFLNIYRQMHIFSPERKESFNKMLLELSPDIVGLFSSLPGGAILQDYIDDLAEKNGMERTVSKNNGGADQQSQILANALASSQGQNVVSPQIIGNAKVSMDKDFAEEFAKVIEGVLQQQANFQKENMEKLTLDISKTQMFIAKSMKESKEEQRQDIAELCKTITSGYKEGREEQRQEFDNLCKAIVKSQTALSTSLVAINNEKNTSNIIKDDTQALIKAILDEQKQINIRLEMVEKMSSLKKDDNAQLISAFEKSQTELIRSLQNINQSTVQVVNTNSNDNLNNERLAQIISETQEKLIKNLISNSLLQSFPREVSVGGAVQPTIVNDSSAQIISLMDKFTSLQENAGKNIEKAIVKVIEEQGKLYDKINNKQTKELAEIISLGFSNIKISQTPNINTVTDVYFNNQYEKHIENKEELPLQNYNQKVDDRHTDETSSFDINDNVNTEEFEIIKNNECGSLYGPIDDNIIDDHNDADTPKKKKRKKKKKKKSDSEFVDNYQQDISDETIEDKVIDDMMFDDVSISVDNEIEIEDIINIDKDAYSSTESEFATSDDISSIVINANENDVVDNATEKEYTSEVVNVLYDEEYNVDEYIIEAKAKENFTADDWGISSVSEEDNSEKNSIANDENSQDQDWEWEYIEDYEIYDNDDNIVETIGSSFIKVGDINNKNTLIEGINFLDDTIVDVISNPLIYDEGIGEEDSIDPYKNSILKD